MDNAMLQFITAKNEVFSLPANSIKFVGKSKFGTRIYIENDIYYDVVNQYESVLRCLSDNGFAVIVIPVLQD